LNTVLDKIKQYDDFLDSSEIEEIYKFLSTSHNWSFQSSIESQSNYIFLMLKGLENNDLFKDKIFKKIQEKIGEDYNIIRIYANGQYFGMPGRPHHDNTSPNAYTFLIYVNPSWDFLWCGQTIFFDRYATDDNGGTIVISNETKIVYPFPGRAVLFPGNIIHYAESPSKDCFNFRFSIAYKLEKKS